MDALPVTTAGIDLSVSDVAKRFGTRAVLVEAGAAVVAEPRPQVVLVAAAGAMVHQLAAGHGEDVANTVADQLIYSTIRTDQDTQRLSIPTRIGVRHPKLSQVIQMMEGNIEDPMSPADLAEDVGMSTRQLERLFRRYLNRSPKRYYMELRLQKARRCGHILDIEPEHGRILGAGLALGFVNPIGFDHQIGRAEAQTAQAGLLEPNRQAKLVTVEGDAVIEAFGKENNPRGDQMIREFCSVARHCASYVKTANWQHPPTPST